METNTGRRVHEPFPVTSQVRPLQAGRPHRQTSGTTSSRPEGPAATLAPARGSRISRELLVFGAIGVVSTAAYAAIYVVLRAATGPVVANAAALLITAVGNTAANRRFTFGVRTRDRAAIVRDQLAGIAALGVALAITTSAAAVLGRVAPDAGRAVELGVLIVANGLATVTRFVLLRSVIAGARPSIQPQHVRIGPRSQS